MMNKFNYDLDFNATDFRENPSLYRIGVGEQGVLLVEPYKSEILPFWKFKNVELAKKSSEDIYRLFENYLKSNDFVGADMARKYLQMGFTRARRYANHANGHKYVKENVSTTVKEYPYSSGSKFKENPVLPQEEDALTSEKAQVATIFKEAWFKAKDNPEYLKQKAAFKRKYYDV
jgi:Domain of unknown function (DUF4385)